MKYNPKIGFFGNLERAFSELTKTNRNVFNAKSETNQKFSEVNESLALADETAIELYEVQMAQEDINAAQDDALIELYEMIGGN